jgi:hypothetical protein
MNITTNRRVKRGAAGMAVAAIAIGMLLAAPRLAVATAAPAPPEVPQDIAVPAGNVLLTKGAAEGFQIYTCQTQGTGYGWILQQPMAVLLSTGHKPFALHYGGPTWLAVDGSAVVGARAGSTPSPVPNAIPWLLLTATPAPGAVDGYFTGITFIHRLNTTGGVAPATGCDGDHVGATARIFYTADYYFYRAG